MIQGAGFCSSCGAPVITAAAQSQQTAAAAQGSGSAQNASAVNDLMNTYYNAAQGAAQNAQGVQPAQAAQAQPAQAQAQPVQPAAQAVNYSAYPQYAPVEETPKKRKKVSKAVPAACIAGGVVLLAGTGLVVYNCNKAAFTHLALGDAGYAHSITSDTLSNAAKSESLMGSQSVVKSVMSAQSKLNGSYDSYDYFDSYSDAQDAQQSIAINTCAQLLEDAFGEAGVEVTVTAGAELTDDGIEALANSMGADESDTKELVNALSDVKLRFAEKLNDGSFEGAASFSVGGDDVIAVQARYEEDGSCSLIMPGISEIGVKAQLSEIDWDFTESADIPEYDVNVLINNISEKAKPLFEDYEYEYTNGKTDVEGLEFNGMTVEIALGQDDLAELSCTALEVMLDDDDFLEYCAALSGEEISEVKSSLQSSLDDMEYNKENATDETLMKVYFYVNNDNSLAGFSLDVEEAGSAFTYLNSGDDYVLTSKSNGEENFRVEVDGTSSDSGNAVITVNTGYQTAEFNVKYSGLGMMTVFGQPSIKGSFEITSGSGNVGLDDWTLSVSAQPNGSGAKYSVGVSNAEYGKVNINIDAGTAGTVAPVPDSSYKLYDATDGDTSALNLMGEDLSSHLESLTQTNSVIKRIYEMVNGTSSDSDYAATFMSHTTPAGTLPVRN